VIPFDPGFSTGEVELEALPAVDTDASRAFLAASHCSSNDEVTVTGVRGATRWDRSGEEDFERDRGERMSGAGKAEGRWARRSLRGISMYSSVMTCGRTRSCQETGPKVEAFSSRGCRASSRFLPRPARQTPYPHRSPRRHVPARREGGRSRTCFVSLISTARDQVAPHSILPTRPRSAQRTNLFRGLRRVEMSISMWDHCWAEKGGVREGSGIQWTEETSD
jgi:hypothetical protein